MKHFSKSPDVKPNPENMLRKFFRCVAPGLIIAAFSLTGCSDSPVETCALTGFSVDGQQYGINYDADGLPSALVLNPAGGSAISLLLTPKPDGGIARIDLPAPLGPGYIENSFDSRNNLIRSDKVINEVLQTRRDFEWSDAGQLLEIRLYEASAGQPVASGKVTFTYSGARSVNPVSSADYDQNGALTVEADYEYDRQKTPFGKSFGFLFNVFSGNNITRATYRRFGADDIVLENSHTYNQQGYPVQIILRESAGPEKVQSFSYSCR